MASKETRIAHDIILNAGAKLFKNVRGMFYTRTGTPIKAGLGCNGAGDLIGFLPVKITPEMVGKTVAIFMSVEVKTETGKIKPDQLLWVDAVKKSGGIACIARNVEDVKKCVDIAMQ